MQNRRLRSNNASRPDDIRQLITGLGGDASLPALFDVRRGITASSTLVTQWDDCRGASGFAPSLTASGTQRPTLDPALLTLSFDGVTNLMTTSLSSLFDASVAISIFIVASIKQTAATAVPLSIAESASPSHFLLIRNTSGSGGTIQVQMGGVAEDSTVVVSTSRRLAIASKDATTGFAIDVPNATRVAGTTTARTSGTNALVIGNTFAAATAPALLVVRAAGVLARQATAADITRLKAWANAVHGAVLA